MEVTLNNPRCNVSISREGYETQNDVFDILENGAIKNYSLKPLMGVKAADDQNKSSSESVSKLSLNEEPRREKVKPAYHKFKIGMHASVYTKAANLNTGLKFGGDLSLQLFRKIDFWISGELTNRFYPDDGDEDLYYQHFGLSASMRYFFNITRKLQLFAGGGGDFIRTVNSTDPNRTYFYFQLLAGTQYEIFNRFNFHVLFRGKIPIGSENGHFLPYIMLGFFYAPF